MQFYLTPLGVAADLGKKPRRFPPLCILPFVIPLCVYAHLRVYSWNKHGNSLHRMCQKAKTQQKKQTHFAQRRWTRAKCSQMIKMFYANLHVLFEANGLILHK